MVEQAQDRIPPYPTWRETLTYVGFPLLGPLFLAGMAAVLPCAGVIAIALSGWLLVRYSHPLILFIATFAQRRRFDAMSATAQAAVVDRRAIEQKSSLEVTYRYEVVIRFEAHRLDGSIQQVTLHTWVRQSVYDSLENSDTISVRYSQEDPRIALLNGEENFEPLRGGFEAASGDSGFQMEHLGQATTPTGDRSFRTGLRRPNKITVVEGPDELTLTYRWTSRFETLFYAVVAVVCGGWSAVNIISYARAGGTVDVVRLYALGGALVTIGFVYWCAAYIFNSTIYHVTHEAITLRHRPLPWAGNRTIPIGQIQYIDRLSYESNDDFHRLYLNLVNGENVGLMSGFSWELDFVKYEFETWLWPTVSQTEEWALEHPQTT